MENFINLKRTSAEIKDEQKEYTEPQVDSYPYGLSLRLENEVVQKLGIADQVVAGEIVTFTAKALIESVSVDDTDKDGKTTSVRLKVTDMAFPKAKATVEEQANKLFPSEKT